MSAQYEKTVRNWACGNSSKKNKNAKKLHKQLMTLPLLPANKFDEGYESIKRFAIKTKLSKRFNKLFAYYESYWLKQVGLSSKMPRPHTTR